MRLCFSLLLWFFNSLYFLDQIFSPSYCLSQIKRQQTRLTCHSYLMACLYLSKVFQRRIAVGSQYRNYLKRRLIEIIQFFWKILLNSFFNLFRISLFDLIQISKIKIIKHKKMKMKIAMISKYNLINILDIFFIQLDICPQYFQVLFSFIQFIYLAGNLYQFLFIDNIIDYKIHIKNYGTLETLLDINSLFIF
ncbi:unnamed protein product (macronuclear) [Paramecium tetraurelia]|uniref:Transmembrane protein n=1 Tax=Paramecium tetraurelia TaxID=5888 RepID=A0E866_PARTE|nr:uncharacterized protein GSPATT00024211001 [Paramecium tetraurelia]CAK91483.1 unnamed protein product [Paramecium tetraurelia]|eukprot:XP_001458880.1 hypothetical protein (macronuclear) [Paramecium tetraurelia strain d4-2]